jgi:hypothetical protein
MDPTIATDPSKQRVIMRFPTDESVDGSSVFTPVHAHNSNDNDTNSNSNSNRNTDSSSNNNSNSNIGINGNTKTNWQKDSITNTNRGSNRVTPAASGGMYALTYPAVLLNITTPLSSTSTHRANSATGAGSSVVVAPSAPVQLFVHTGGWKVAALQYGRWLRSVIGTRAAPDWLDAVHSKGSAWVPDAATVAASKASQDGGLTTFEDLYGSFFQTEIYTRGCH